MLFRSTALLPPLERRVRRHFWAAGTRPYRFMTATSATLSGGPPALTTEATSSKYLGPISGASVISARVTRSNGFEKP